MNNSEVRAHLRKGELAVALVEALGYAFGTDPENPNRNIWIAPPAAPEDAVVKAVKDLIETSAKAKLETIQRCRQESTEGPNWDLVKGMVGKVFRIRQENIPKDHPLHGYGMPHFAGVNFYAESIQYERGLYTGYTVSFKFRMRPYGTLRTMRLPLSCAAFQA